MRQRGLAVIGALFLVVTLAALAALALRLGAVRAQGLTLEGRHDLAELAASAGVEWGAYRVLRQAAACPFVQTLPPLPGSLRGFTVQVRCEPLAGAWRLTALARAGTDATQPDYVERQLTLEVAP